MLWEWDVLSLTVLRNAQIQVIVKQVQGRLMPLLPPNENDKALKKQPSE